MVLHGHERLNLSVLRGNHSAQLIHLVVFGLLDPLFFHIDVVAPDLVSNR